VVCRSVIAWPLSHHPTAVHASTANLTDHVRISCDVRWQPARDPVDDRYMRPGETRPTAGAWAKDAPAGAASSPSTADSAMTAEEGEVGKATVTMPELRAQWGLLAGTT